MTCYTPLKGWRSRLPSKNGKFPMVFNLQEGYVDKPMQTNCGRCIGCRIDRSRQWAVRNVHESTLHDHNCFITLTFNDQFLPKNGSLDVSVFQRFMKRLRKRYGSGIRYYHCGEYGENFGRPHYHALIFGHDFKDRGFWKHSNGVPLYVSDELSSLWTCPETRESYGYTSVGNVTFQSAAYVSRYMMKKIGGDMAEEHYLRLDVDELTGELLSKYSVVPEYSTMSRRPGIASDWFKQFKGDVFPHDFCVMSDGKKVKPPRYYDAMYELEYPDDHAKVKERRRVRAAQAAPDNTPERLFVKEYVKRASLERLIRPLR